MGIANRIILLIAGLGLAWCAVWGASEMRVFAVNAKLTGFTGPALLINIVSFVSLIVGVYSLKEFFKGIEAGLYPIDGIDVGDATVHLACFAFLFGSIVAPIKIGSGIWDWATPWLFLLILGFLPMAFVVKDIAVDFLNAVPHTKNVHGATVQKPHQ